MKRLILVIVAVFAFCIVAIALKNEYGRLLLSKSDYGMQALISGNAKTDYLFVGSSMFRQGIDIDALEKHSKKSSWILAYNGNFPMVEYLELKYLLENGVTFKTLFLDMYAYSAVNPPKISDERIFLHSDTRFKLNLWNLLCEAPETDRSDFWEMFVTSNNETLLTWPINKRLVENRYRRGGNIAEVPGGTKESVEQTVWPVATQTSLREDQKKYLVKIVELLRQHEIEMVMIETPKYKELVGSREYTDIMKDYAFFLDSLKVRYVLSSETEEVLKNSGYNPLAWKIVPFDSSDPQFFQDRIHLSSNGRATYTTELLKQVEE